MFKEISQEALQKIGKAGTLKEQERVEQFIDTNLLKNTMDDCSRLLILLMQIEEEQQKKDYKKLRENSRKAIYASERLTQSIRQIPVNFGQREESMYLNGNYELIPEDAKAVKLSLEDENIIKIVLKDLLPRRQNSKYFENSDYFRFLYTQAFHSFFKDKEIFYEEKVVILFKNFFLSDKDMIDDDNFDTKIITDCIATYVLIDDNPKRCMKVYDYGLADTRHTEILVFPLSKWVQYVDMPFT